MRLLMKSPGAAGIALLALALGIGANTAIFTLVDAALLRPLPYRNAERLLMLWESNPGKRLPKVMVSAPNFIDFREQNQVFEDLAAYAPASFALTGQGEPRHVQGARVSSELFSILGVQPVRGRSFQRSETEADDHRVVLVSYGFWQRHFGASPGTVGSKLVLDGGSYTVAGIMPLGFEFPERGTDVWTPLVFEKTRTQRGNHYLGVVGRLKPRVRLREARAQIHQIARRLALEYPATNRGWDANLISIREQQVGDVRPALLVLQGAVAFVLLLTCVNVANLLLVRNLGRSKEVAVRTVLGAGRARLFRQFLTESLLLACSGGLLGLALAPALARLLLAFRPTGIPLPENVHVDWNVLGFALLASLATGLLFGLMPALQGSRANLDETLRESTRSATQGRRSQRMRAGLVVAEVALSLVLLMGAGVMLRSVLRLHAVELGFRPDRVLTVELELPEPKYDGAQPKTAFFRNLLERLAALPAVEAAGLTDCLPLVSDFTQVFAIEGNPAPAPGEAPAAGLRVVTPDYFRALGIPLRAGRGFASQDGDGAPQVALINETAARRYWPECERLGDIAGRRIHLGLRPEAPWLTVVGVVNDVRHRAIDAPFDPELYLPYFQAPTAGVTLVLRTASDPAALAGAVRARIRALDPEQPVGKMRTMAEVVADSMASRFALTVLLTAFGVLALALAAAGIYGVVASTVAQRAGEIGIRMALGARPHDVRGMIVRQALGLALAGVAAGSLAGFALNRLLSGLLFQASATDPGMLLGPSAVLLATVLLACYLPARKATRGDPLGVLRTP